MKYEIAQLTFLLAYVAYLGIGPGSFDACSHITVVAMRKLKGEGCIVRV
jgi:hypothetical protein